MRGRGRTEGKMEEMIFFAHIFSRQLHYIVN
jgi:hypothetical protein